MPRTHTLSVGFTLLGGGGPGVCGRLEEEEAREASTAERSRVLAQSRSLKERLVESRRGGGRVDEEDTELGFIYSRSLKFCAVEKERSTRSRKKKKKLKKKKQKKKKKTTKNLLSYSCNVFVWTVRERHL